ncbi:hypothetical protein HaLaN_13865, partial [Haematococcus lacustris]
MHDAPVHALEPPPASPCAADFIVAGQVMEEEALLAGSVASNQSVDGSLPRSQRSIASLEDFVSVLAEGNRAVVGALVHVQQPMKRAVHLAEAAMAPADVAAASL